MSAIARADGLRPRPEVAVRRTADEPGKEGLEGGVSIARDAIPRTLSRLSSVAPLRKTATAGYAPQVRNATKCARAQDPPPGPPARPRSTGRSVVRRSARMVDESPAFGSPRLGDCHRTQALPPPASAPTSRSPSSENSQRKTSTLPHFLLVGFFAQVFGKIDLSIYRSIEISPKTWAKNDFGSHFRVHPKAFASLLG